MIAVGPWLVDLGPWLLAAGGILLRLVGLLAAFPFWSGSPVPARFRALLVAYLSVVMFWSLGLPRVDTVPASVVGWLSVLGPELVFGLALGLMLRVVVAAAAGMGRLISFSVGLGFASFVDPSSGEMSDAAGRLLNIVMLVLFLVLDVHLELLAALFDTFRIHPPGELPVLALVESGAGIASLGSDFFELSVRLAAPVLAGSVMLFTVLAVVSRVAPQMNLFAFGFVITIPMGLLILVAELPEVVALLSDEVQRLPDWLRRFADSGNVP